MDDASGGIIIHVLVSVKYQFVLEHVYRYGILGGNCIIIEKL